MKKKIEIDEIHNSISASYREMYVMKKIMDYINNKHNDFDLKNDDFQDEIHNYRNNVPDKDQCAICYEKGYITHTIHLPKEEINLCNECFNRLPEKLLSALNNIK